MTQGKRPEAPVLKRMGFIVCDGFFGAQGQNRVGGDRLRELFDPQRLRLKRDQKDAAEEAHRLFRAPFFAAQLEYYGIKFPSNYRRDQLEDLLKESVRAGKCKKVPDSIIELEKSMRAEYEPMYRAWKGEVSEWDARKKAMEDGAWAQCSTPLERAEHSLDRFISHYFLTNGEPDPSKTKKPIALPGFRNRSAVHSWADRVPGLETRSGGEEPNRTLFIGWGRSAVWDMAREADAEAYRQQGERANDRWAEVEEEHREFVKTAKKGAKKVNAKSPTPAVLQKIVGSYVVRCEDIEEQWPSEHELTLDIAFGPKDNVLEGAVSFNVIEGTMLLALSDDILDELDVDTLDSDDSDDSDEDDEDEEPALSKKRAAPAPKHKPGRPKKAKTNAQTRHIPLRIRGRETGEGEMFYDSERGHLEFTDNTYTRFTGVVGLPHVGPKVEFEGLKVDSEPQQQADAWEEFSERQYEYERVARWH